MLREVYDFMQRCKAGMWPTPWLALAPGPLQGVFFPGVAWQIDGVRSDGLPSIQDMPRLVQDLGEYPRLTLLPEGDETDYGRMLYKDQLSLDGTPSTGTEFTIWDAAGDNQVAIYEGRCDLKLRGLSLTLGTDFTIDDSGQIITTTVRGSTSGEPGESDFTDFYLAWAFVRT